MSTLTITLLVVVFIVTDIVVVGAVMQMVGQSLKRLRAQFPPIPRNANAVERRFQSFKVGMGSLGFSIHAAVDENALHLTPTTFARWIGMKPMSLPWGAFKSVKPVMGGVSASIAGVTIVGPKWCMELATNLSSSTKSPTEKVFPPDNHRAAHEDDLNAP